MKDFNPHDKEAAIKVMAAEQRQALQQQLVQKVPIKPGHRMFEVDLANGVLTESKIETVGADFITGNRIRKLNTKPNHYYLSALNAKNAIRHFNKKVKEWAQLAEKETFDLNGKSDDRV